MRHITAILTATALLGLFGTAAVADPIPPGIDAPTDASPTEGVELLSDRDLMTVTGAGWFKRVACGIANGAALGGGVVAAGAAIVGATLPPVLAGGIIVAGIGAGICFFL